MTDISKEEMRERLGNIEQIRELLFGHKTKEYDQNFQKYEQRLGKLELELANFEQEIGEKITQLQISLTNEIRSAADSLEKKLKYLSLTTHEETSKLQQQIQLVEQKYAHNLDSLQKTINTKTNLLQEELYRSRTNLQEDMQRLETQFFDDLAKNIAQLKEGKVSRIDLAEILFELCLKVKGAEFVPDLKQAVENQVKAEFILPDQE